MSEILNDGSSFAFSACILANCALLSITGNFPQFATKTNWLLSAPEKTSSSGIAITQPYIFLISYPLTSLDFSSQKHRMLLYEFQLRRLAREHRFQSTCAPMNLPRAVAV